jgi:hypothetical protein
MIDEKKMNIIRNMSTLEKNDEVKTILVCCIKDCASKSIYEYVIALAQAYGEICKSE